MRKKWLTILRKKDGVTMVEVLIAFIVVVLMLGAFSTIVSTSVSLTNRASQMIQNSETFQGEYYKKDKPSDTLKDHLTLQYQPKEGSNEQAYTLTLPKAKLKQFTDPGTGMSRSFVERDGDDS
ncbi:MAG: hypothetical protein PUC32_07920 [Oscillospiraceae bacterium]|nr:hypothetical protein [Oscillospiraceae bacterium]